MEIVAFARDIAQVLRRGTLLLLGIVVLLFGTERGRHWFEVDSYVDDNVCDGCLLPATDLLPPCGWVRGGKGVRVGARRADPTCVRV